jgi:uncharacterized membrane protein YkoI
MIRTLATAAVLLALHGAAGAVADEQRTCLSAPEQRAAIAGGQVIPLAAAIRSARGSVGGRGAREVVKARLCREGGGLAYVLTVLARDGKVSRTTIDAGSGRVVDAR